MIPFNLILRLFIHKLIINICRYEILYEVRVWPKFLHFFFNSVCYFTQQTGGKIYSIYIRYRPNAFQSPTTRASVYKRHSQIPAPFVCLRLLRVFYEDKLSQAFKGIEKP